MADHSEYVVFTIYELRPQKTSKQGHVVQKV